MPGNTLSDQAIRDLREMKAWFRHFPRVLAGAGGMAFPPLPHEVRRFELKEDLTPASSGVAAYRLTYSSTAATYTTTGSTSTFDVYDAVGGRRALGKDSVNSTSHGARGVAWKPHDCARWEIASVQEKARLIRGSNGVVTANSTYALTSPVSLDGGQLPSTSISVTNYDSDLGTSSGQTTIVADGAGGYRTLDGPCST